MYVGKKDSNRVDERDSTGKERGRGGGSFHPNISYPFAEKLVASRSAERG